jgi:hypothetical protein
VRPGYQAHSLRNKRKKSAAPEGVVIQRTGQLADAAIGVIAFERLGMFETFWGMASQSSRAAR